MFSNIIIFERVMRCEQVVEGRNEPQKRRNLDVQSAVTVSECYNIDIVRSRVSFLPLLPRNHCCSRCGVAQSSAFQCKASAVSDRTIACVPYQFTDFSAWKEEVLGSSPVYPCTVISAVLSIGVDFWPISMPFTSPFTAFFEPWTRCKVSSNTFSAWCSASCMNIQSSRGNCTDLGSLATLSQSALCHMSLVVSPVF